MRRMTYVQQRVLDELRRNPQQSYESLAAATGADRSSIIICVKRMELLRHVLVERGRGPYPNSYRVLTDRVR